MLGSVSCTDLKVDVGDFTLRVRVACVLEELDEDVRCVQVLHQGAEGRHHPVPVRLHLGAFPQYFHVRDVLQLGEVLPGGRVGGEEAGTKQSREGEVGMRSTRCSNLKENRRGLGVGILGAGTGVGTVIRWD